MSEENVDARPLTSVELLDAAAWRKGRWLLEISDAPEMDVVLIPHEYVELLQVRR